MIGADWNSHCAHCMGYVRSSPLREAWLMWQVLNILYSSKAVQNIHLQLRANEIERYIWGSHRERSKRGAIILADLRLSSLSIHPPACFVRLTHSSYITSQTPPSLGSHRHCSSTSTSNPWVRIVPPDRRLPPGGGTGVSVEGITP